jgi:hypothetical protein
MSLLISQSRILLETTEDSDAAEHLEELRETNLRLQLLVCELLAKNQQLRFQRAKGQETISIDTPMRALAEGSDPQLETKKAKAPSQSASTRAGLIEGDKQ